MSAQPLRVRSTDLELFSPYQYQDAVITLMQAGWHPATCPVVTWRAWRRCPR